ERSWSGAVMELRELQYFVATADALSFRKAAEGLYISQPALSRRIAGLEKELGVRLFRRDRRGVELTEVGQRILVQAKEVLLTAQRAVEAVRATHDSRRLAISIGLGASSATTLFAPLLQRLREDWPTICIELPPGEVSAQLAELRLGKLDVVLGFLPHDG